MSAVLELAERCEAATGGDFGMDCDIARLIGYSVVSPPTGGFGMVAPHPIPRFTASLDAAMSLVPEGWSVKLFAHFGDEPRTFAEVFLLDLADMTPDRGFLKGPVEADASTPALALCAAALRARAQGDAS